MSLLRAALGARGVAEASGFPFMRAVAVRLNRTWSNIFNRKASMSLTIVSRRKWGAKAPTSRTRVRWAGTKRALRVHHTADIQPPLPTATIAQESSYLRNIQHYHMTTRGYSDIAYSYIIMPSGRVYVGRGFGVLGAHTLSHNEDVGVCFAGNYSQKQPTDVSLAAFWQLKRHLKLRGVRGLNAVPHRATFATACPGSKLVKSLGL